MGLSLELRNLSTLPFTSPAQTRYSAIMQKRLTAALIALSLVYPGTAALAQTSAAPPPAVPAKPAKLVRIDLTTSAGVITLDLDLGQAPITAGNFLRYVDQKRFDGAVFYRSVKITPDFGMIQGGARNDPKRVLPPIAHEPTSKTGILHTNGTISMARAKPGSANGDFFIVIGTMPALDANPKEPGDNLGYAAFGKVVDGFDAVRKIYDAPTPPTLGVKEGMKGQILAAPIRIISARRGKPAVAVPTPVASPVPPKP